MITGIVVFPGVLSPCNYLIRFESRTKTRLVFTKL
jgi:hypothetical protein